MGPTEGNAQSQLARAELMARLCAVRCALYMPANNSKAVSKAPHLAADLIIFDLEDAVAPSDKPAAREDAMIACRQNFGQRLTAIRCNGLGTPQYEADAIAIAASNADFIVVPKVERATEIDALSHLSAKPVIAMIETCTGLYNARDIASHSRVFGLFAGTNDLAHELGIDLTIGRNGMALALQMMVLAARAAGKAVFDGVNNNLDDMTSLKAEAQEAKMFGFTSKTAIHPRQIEPINAAFSPSPAQIDDAVALLAAANGGAERFRGRMVEAMHVDAAKRLLSRSGMGEG